MKNIKNILIGIVVVVVLLIGGLTIKSFIPVASEVHPQNALAAQVQNDQFQFTAGIAEGSPVAVNHNRVKLTLGARQNQASWLNTTGTTVIVSNVAGILTSSKVGISPVASSTLVYSVATSTTPTVVDSQTAPAFAGILDSYLIATSTTNNITIDADKELGTNGQGTVSLLNGQYLIVTLENPYLTAGTCTGTPLCENATSTNRGYNIDTYADIVY